MHSTISFWKTHQHNKKMRHLLLVNLDHWISSVAFKVKPPETHFDVSTQLELNASVFLYSLRRICSTKGLSVRSHCTKRRLQGLWSSYFSFGQFRSTSKRFIRLNSCFCCRYVPTAPLPRPPSTFLEASQCISVQRQYLNSEREDAGTHTAHRHARHFEWAWVLQQKVAVAQKKVQAPAGSLLITLRFKDCDY